MRTTRLGRELGDRGRAPARVAEDCRLVAGRVVLGEARAVAEGRLLGDMTIDLRTEEVREAEGEPGIESGGGGRRDRREEAAW